MTPAPAPAPAPAHAAPDDPLDRPPRRTTVYLGILAAAVLLAAVLGLFIFRALAGREPSHVAVVIGNEAWLGAELTVEGDAIPNPYGAVVERSDRFSVPFFLPPGRYTLHARSRGAEVYRHEFTLDRETREYIHLPANGPTTRP